ncbi:response regulator transcription factor [Paenibacillus chitinolyticus]|uniref:response regulator transcription factor n=1 Tax=Paenibacillus chitinolyticus TaxID=79263 RepID=UPI001C468DDC|nr:response regulator transcription factor [Paenibacillus chitinolyticus]MBV6715242.1 response regulator transcription factor [Paenibacillus chitinolyticus]
MKGIHILIADDEKEIRELLKTYLERETYMADTAHNGEEALRLAEERDYSLIVLDLMMPKVDGIEVCRRLRQTSNVPILMLTAKDQEVDKLVGLSIGADDYITKPFSIHEVIARIKAHLRRYKVLGSENSENSPAAETALTSGDLKLDPKTFTLTKDGEEIALTAKEFELLKFFMTNPEQVFTKTQIFRQVWNSDYLEDDNTVMVHIRKLRKKIEEDPSDPKRILTVWGIGYKFAGERI